MLVAVGINSNYVNHLISEKISAILSEEWETKVSIEGFRIGINPTISLFNLRVLDQNKDSIISFSELSAKLSYSELFQKRVHITNFQLKKANSTIGFEKNKTLNIQFLIDYYKPVEPIDTNKSEWDFSISNLSLNLEQINFTYYDINDSLRLNCQLNSSQINMGENDMSKLLMECRDFQLKNSFFKMSLNKDSYDFRVNSIQAQNIWINPLNFEYIARNISVETDSLSISFHNSIDLITKSLSLQAKDILIFKDDYSAIVENLNAKSFNEVQDINIEGVLQFTAEKALANKLNISTRTSKAKINTNIFFQDYKHLGALKFQKESFLELNSQVNSNELINLTQVPELSNYITDFDLSAKIFGNDSFLKVQQINYSDKNNKILFSGTASHLLSKDSLLVNLSAVGDLSTQLIDSVSNLKMEPQDIRIKSRIKGGVKELFISADAESENGEFALQSTILYPKIDVKLKSRDFPINTHISDSVFIGRLSVDANFENASFEMDDNFVSNGSVIMDYVELNNKTYRDFNCKWKLDKGKGYVEAEMQDSLIDLSIDSKIKYSTNSFYIKGKTNIEHLYTSLLSDSIFIKKIKSKISFEAQQKQSFRSVHLDLKNSKLVLENSDVNYSSLAFIYTEDKESTYAKLTSTPIHLELNSNVPTDSLELYFKRIASRYIELSDSTIIDTVSRNQTFNIDLVVKGKDPLLEHYTLGFLNFNNANLNLESSINDGIRAKLQLPTYAIDKFSAEDISVNIEDNDSKLAYQLKLGQTTWDSITFYNIRGNGILSDSLLTIDILNKKKNSEEVTANHINLEMALDNNGFWQINSTKDWVLLSKKWEVSGEGVRTNFKQIKDADIRFKKNTSKLHLRVDENKFIAEAKGLLFDKQLAHYTGIPFTSHISFKLIGDKRNIKKAAFNTTINLDSIKMDGIYFGDLSGNIVRIKNRNEITVEAMLSKDNYRSNIQGRYDISQSRYLTTINLHEFPLSVIEPFVKDITDLSGEINGEILSNYSKNKHHLNANIILENDAFTYSPLKSQFNIPEGKLIIDDNILTADFSILDIQKNDATIKGKVHLSPPYTLDLKLNSKKFILMDNNEKDNEEFNGKLVVSTNAKIKGTSSKPEIIAFLGLEKGTKINILNNDRSLQKAQAHSDLVVFTNPSDTNNYKAEVVDTIQSIKASIKGNININPKTELKIIFDPVNQDFLSVKGGGDLSYELNENGDESLTGTYQISEGSYKITFQELISKQFIIGKNSSLIWVGEKEDPELRLNTHYNFRTSPYSLVGNQGTMSDREKEMYSGMHSFRLNMTIQGSLSKPELSFKIEDTENTNSNTISTISNELDRINNDASSLNQNVFSILLFNKFVSINNESMGANADVIVNSLGQLVTGELNKLTSEYVNFVDINVGFNTQLSDDSAGVQSYSTSVDLKIEKSFYNDRVRVKVGGVWDVQDNTNSSKSYKNDFSIEYRITKDGRYLAKVYNKDDKDYDGTDVTRNGVSISYSKDFDSYNIFFKKPKKTEIENDN